MEFTAGAGQMIKGFDAAMPRDESWRKVNNKYFA
ncbi:MAG: hypothetical protein WKF59_13220 [Chitinophagaceae bacterium]